MKYGGSDLVVQLVQLVNRKSADGNVSINRINAIHLRDHLMFMMVMINVARSRNLLNMSLYEFNAAERVDDLDYYFMRSTSYKTSLLYKDKI